MKNNKGALILFLPVVPLNHVSFLQTHMPHVTFHIYYSKWMSEIYVISLCYVPLVSRGGGRKQFKIEKRNKCYSATLSTISLKDLLFTKHKTISKRKTSTQALAGSHSFHWSSSFDSHWLQSGFHGRTQHSPTHAGSTLLSLPHSAILLPDECWSALAAGLTSQAESTHLQRNHTPADNKQKHTRHLTLLKDWSFTNLP